MILKPAVIFSFLFLSVQKLKPDVQQNILFQLSSPKRQHIMFHLKSYCVLI